MMDGNELDVELNTGVMVNFFLLVNYSLVFSELKRLSMHDLHIHHNDSIEPN